MRTRRQLLFDIAAFASLEDVLGPQHILPRKNPVIISEAHCLSEESANGFRRLLDGNKRAIDISSRNIVILPGMRYLPKKTAVQLFQRVHSGTWLILESGMPFASAAEAAERLRVLHSVFGLTVHVPVPARTAEVGPSNSYVAYTWPGRFLVRDFSAVTPVQCSQQEVIASFRDMAVCAKRSVGAGGIIFLGSMLGPALLAQEREAQELGKAILEALPAASI